MVALVIVPYQGAIEGRYIHAFKGFLFPLYFSCLFKELHFFGFFSPASHHVAARVSTYQRWLKTAQAVGVMNVSIAPHMSICNGALSLG